VAGESFRNACGEIIVRKMIAAIRDNAAMLSEIDGAIGDGDHGINMGKGFALCGDRLDGAPGGFSEALRTLGEVLFTEIGGAMGPLYGTLFDEMAKTGGGEEVITAVVFGRMLDRAASAVVDLGGAKVGDKTMVDALVPARDAYVESVRAGAGFSDSLAAMAGAARKGRDSTRDMAAKLGRASRLGERSRGVLDAGAASCTLLLETMAGAITVLLADG
jgi:dihydroxyacetone kinase-like protein